MPSFLEKIYSITQERVAEAKKTLSAKELEEKDLFHRVPHKVKTTFTRDDYNIIAEIKFASPSKGDIHSNHNPVQIAESYLEAGASMLSILTEPVYFKGKLTYLESIRKARPEALLLRKDFIIDPYQLLEAKAHGADAVLLIVAMTGSDLTKDLFDQALEIGLTPLVEVHSDAELEQAFAINADFIGVNNRNLKTLKINLDTGRCLVSRKPENSVFICESGLSSAEDLRSMRKLGYNGFLMGTSFMCHNDPGIALKNLRKTLECV